jgi:phage shock protein PspC (stress-responsive transcriptional regulator)
MARTLTRDPGRAVLGGVAAGFGRYLDVDPVLVRLAFVILFFANGLGLLLYLASWALMPKEGATAAVGLASVEGAFAGARDAAEEAARAIGRSTEDAGGARLVIGYGLIALGIVLLLNNLDWIRWPHWARFEVLWPIVLVGMGAGLVHRSLRRKEPA